MLRLKLTYRFRYYWKKVCNFLGFCPKCWSRTNLTGRGRHICPKCGR
jgi:predicted amidophosphoribosyltransferase